MNKDIECIECKYFVRCPAGYSYKNAACLSIREPIKLSEYELNGLQEKMEKAIELVNKAVEKCENE